MSSTGFTLKQALRKRASFSGVCDICFQNTNYTGVRKQTTTKTNMLWLMFFIQESSQTLFQCLKALFWPHSLRTNLLSPRQLTESGCGGGHVALSLRFSDVFTLHLGLTENNSYTLNSLAFPHKIPLSSPKQRSSCTIHHNRLTEQTSLSYPRRLLNMPTRG